MEDINNMRESLKNQIIAYMSNRNRFRTDDVVRDGITVEVIQKDQGQYDTASGTTEGGFKHE